MKRGKENKQLKKLGIRIVSSEVIRKKEERERNKKQLIESLPNLIWIIAITLTIGFFGGNWSVSILVGIGMFFGL